MFLIHHGVSFHLSEQEGIPVKGEVRIRQNKSKVAEILHHSNLSDNQDPSIEPGPKNKLTRAKCTQVHHNKCGDDKEGGW